MIPTIIPTAKIHRRTISPHRDAMTRSSLLLISPLFLPRVYHSVDTITMLVYDHTQGQGERIKGNESKRKVNMSECSGC